MGMMTSISQEKRWQKSSLLLMLTQKLSGLDSSPKPSKDVTSVISSATLDLPPLLVVLPQLLVVVMLQLLLLKRRKKNLTRNLMTIWDSVSSIRLGVYAGNSEICTFKNTVENKKKKKKKKKKVLSLIPLL